MKEQKLVVWDCPNQHCDAQNIYDIVGQFTHCPKCGLIVFVIDDNVIDYTLGVGISSKLLIEYQKSSGRW